MQTKISTAKSQKIYKGNMEKLKFPIIRKPHPAPKTLSMDDYARFVSFNLKHAVNKKVYQQWKKDSGVNTAFVLK